MGVALLLVARLAVTGFALLTWAYCVTTYSPFAFDMFVRPQLFPWLGDFVVWHHAWYWAAFVVSVATLAPDLMGARGRASWSAARVMAAAYVLVFGAVGVHLLGTPYLPSLTSQPHSFVAAFAPLVPLAWLAAIDHLATRQVVFVADHAARVTLQRQLLMASLGAALCVWLGFAAHAAWRGDEIWSAAPWAAAAAWSLVLGAGASMAVYAGLSLVVSLAAARRHPRAWEYGLSVLALAAGLAECFRRGVFPALSFSARDGLVIALGAGATLAAAWSGLRLRLAASSPRVQSGIEMLVAPHTGSTALRVTVILGVVLAARVALDRTEQLDWFFLVQTTIVLAEGLLLFGVWLTVPVRARRWSATTLIAPPLVTLALLHVLPVGIGAWMTATGNDALDPEALLDRYSVTDPSLRFGASRFIDRGGPDPDYYQDLLRRSARSLEPLRTTPRIDFAAAAPVARTGTPPHVFLFVIDGLRRDYLSAYNPDVRFTPGIGAWAGESLAFDNAFTRFGGTLLAMPSLWVGGQVTRSWGRGAFDRMNALERLMTGDGYQFLINDHTVADRLGAGVKPVFLDPDVKSIDTDVCSLVQGLQQHLATTTDRRPVFAFLAPMNVHMLNNPRSGTVNAPGQLFHGFYEPYASRVQRVDGCFAGFVAYLRQAGLYDNSVIAITSDHGESLGERGQWGHQYWLFPEDIRIPLIMSVPAAWRTKATADLSRVTFSTDIVPTLYRLLGHDVRDLGPLFGAPLLAPPDQAPLSRRREAFLVSSSYGPSYGLLRRNGRFLYISDLINVREYAFELFRGPLGAAVRVSDDVRRVNQAAIRERVAAIEAFYYPDY